MDRHASITRGRVLAAAAVAAALAFTVLPAHAAAPPPASNVVIDDGGDGFINAAEAGAVTVTGDYDDLFIPAVTSVTARIVADGTCAFVPAGPPTSTPTQTVGVSGGTFSLTFDVSALSETALCVRGFLTNADGNSTTFFSDNQPILDLTAPAAPTITAPADGSLNGVRVRSDGQRVITIAGSTPVGGTQVVVEEAELGPIGTATADAGGAWSFEVQLPTGTHTIVAFGLDAAGNPSAASAPVTFDLDADLPFASISTPPDLTVYLADEPVVIEGIAADTNGQAFAGLLNVEVEIHDPLTVGIDPGRGNVLGVATVGSIVAGPFDVTCSPASAPPAHPCENTGVTQISWSYDAGWLPTGTYSLQFRAFDRAGNEQVQPAVVRIVKL